MNELKLFNSPDFGEVRVVMNVDNEPLFCALDVAKALAYKNPAKAVIQHCKGVTVFGNPYAGRYSANQIHYRAYGTGVQRQIQSRLRNPNDQKARDLVGMMNSKKVRQISTNGELIAIFNSMKQASKVTGVTVSTISRHCLGKIVNPNLGFRFEYL